MEFSLPVYDEDGNQVDTTTVVLNQEQLQDIINCAAEVVYADRLNDGDHENLYHMLAELDEALTSYSVIEDETYEVSEISG